MKRLLAFLLIISSAHAQGPGWNLKPIFRSRSGAASAGLITLDASCTGTGGTQVVPCSAPMTVTAGDTIECEASGDSFDPMSFSFNDPVNGTYDNVVGLVHPNATSTTWVATGVLANSAGGSVTPQVNNWEAAVIAMNVSCRAFKGTATASVLDGGAVNETQSASTASANPTSGTAASPTNSNEAVIGVMVRPSTSATSSGAGWTPSGTLTAVGSGSNYPLYDEYQIQTAAAAVNAPFTSASATFVDSQFALLSNSNPAGYRAITGFYGVPAIAKTNGATASAADLNGATTTLSSLNLNPGWTLISGTAPTYDTSVSPIGTGKVLAAGVPHTFGDAATSIKFTNTGAAPVEYEWDEDFSNHGEPMWLSYFLRVGSSGTVTGQECDSTEIGSSVTSPGQTFQITYDNSTGGLNAFLEDSIDNNQSPRLFFNGSLDTDYWYQLHLAGANERFHQILVYSKSGGTWSLLGTQNFDVLCEGTTGAIPCSGTGGANPLTATASGTGSTSGSSTTLTMSSVSGVIGVGNVVIGTNIQWLTTVAAVTGTGPFTVTLSQASTGTVSGTVSTYSPPVGSAGTGSGTLVAATNGTASSGSTALTIVAPGTGTIVVGDAVGAVSGIAQGTTVAAITGTAVTLSQPTNGALSATGVWFWHPAGSARFAVFGKWSSCSMGGAEWYSGLFFDPFGTWGAFAPN